MPGGRRWRGRGQGRPCAHRISRFVEPCLLLLLHQGDSHGYDLVERIENLGLRQEMVDSSVAYRYLREMEERGFVTSTWETEGSGPPRRVYQLTAEGDQYLAWWIAGLRETRTVLDRFLEAYDEHMKMEEHLIPSVERIIEVDHRITG
jgi:PadR family transcriptional regulator PadR